MTAITRLAEIAIDAIIKAQNKRKMEAIFQIVWEGDKKTYRINKDDNSKEVSERTAYLVLLLADNIIDIWKGENFISIKFTTDSATMRLVNLE